MRPDCFTVRLRSLPGRRSAHTGRGLAANKSEPLTRIFHSEFRFVTMSVWKAARVRQKAGIRVRAPEKALTRIFHTVSTDAAQSGMSTALRLFGRLDILSNMSALPAQRAPCIYARLRTLGTKRYEISGLTRIFHTVSANASISIVGRKAAAS